MDESEAFICKALKGEAIVCFCEPLITQQMKASGSPFGVKIDEKKEHHPIYHLGKMYDAMMLFKPASIKDYKSSHQFSCKIQVSKRMGERGRCYEYECGGKDR